MFAPVRPLLLCHRAGRLRKAITHDTNRPVGCILTAAAGVGDLALFGIESSRDVQGHDSVAVVYDDGGSEAATCFGGERNPTRE